MRTNFKCADYKTKIHNYMAALRYEIYLRVLKNNKMNLLQAPKRFNDGRDNWPNC